MRIWPQKPCALLSALAVATAPSLAAAADVDLVAAEPPSPVFTRLPAVDGVNGKAEFFGDGSASQESSPFGAQNRWSGSGGGAGSLSIPLGTDFGVQVDGLVTQEAGRFAGGGAGHLFWRDPAKGLLGVYGSGFYWGGAGGLGFGNAAAEGAVYLDRWTVEDVVGAEFEPGTGAHGARTRFFDYVSFGYYVTDDLKLSAGHLYTGGVNAAALEVEYMPPGMSFDGVAPAAFVEGIIGERGTAGVAGGLRVYFGHSDKTLIRRHREDDPPARRPIDRRPCYESRLPRSWHREHRELCAINPAGYLCSPCD